MTDRQAELERVARAWLHEQGWCQVNERFEITVLETVVQPLVALLAAREAKVLESFKTHNNACVDFRHCECVANFWYEWIGKPWMDDKQAQERQKETP